ncbi:MAG: DUF1330 domain-containing protein [Pseudomonadota bacterium]
MTKAYWIASVTVHNAERYKDYVSTAKPAFERHGARFLARGGTYESLEGEVRKRNVVIEFASLDEAKACYNSEDYQAAKAIRQTCADANMVIVEGYEG